MGCCFSSKKDYDSDIELSTVTNTAVTCKSGLKGSNVDVSHDSLSNTYKVEGNGILLGSCALECDAAMWEVKLGKVPNSVRVGVKRWNPKKNSPHGLNSQLGDELENANENSPAWYLKDIHTNEGDVIGIFWDQSDLPMLSFSLNGVILDDASVIRIRPSQDVYPAVSVTNGATCELIFDGDKFTYPSKSSKFKMIVCATSLI